MARGVRAVINTQFSISGRYPNGGPEVLLKAGVQLIDVLDTDLFQLLSDGEEVAVVGGDIRRRGTTIASGIVFTDESIHEAMEAARVGIGTELQRFAANTLEYMQVEAPLFFQSVHLPPLKTKFSHRHALVVVRGHDYRADLVALKPYIREYQPVLIGVDGGADALLEMRLTPDVIIGDFDSLSDKAVHCGAELVHHVHVDGRAPGRENLQDWGVSYEEFVTDGMSEDAAMILAYEAGSTLIVAVGTHATMVEFLDKGRKGMSSTFLTRLRLGPSLVDAKGVNRLYEGRVRRRDIALLIFAALLAMLVMTIVSEPLHVFLRGIWLTLRDFWSNLTNAV